MSQNPNTRKISTNLIIGILVTQAFLLISFAWPATRSAPHGVTLAVSAPENVAARLGAKFGSDPNHAFKVLVVNGRNSAMKLVTNRKAYGAIVIDQSGATMIIASGASPAIASALQTILAPVISSTLPAGMTLQIQDVAPNPNHDPHGVGIGASLIPVIIVTIILGSLLGTRLKGKSKKFVGAFAFTLLSSAVVTFTMQTLLRAYTGSFFKNYLIVSLGMLTFVLLTLGAVSNLGLKGIPVAAIFLIVLSFPLSGAQGARELLPAPWGTLGAWLPTGAFNTALRSSSFFNLRGSVASVWVLIVWAAIGSALTVVGAAKQELVTNR